jgi:aldo/keto reductase family protein
VAVSSARRGTPSTAVVVGTRRRQVCVVSGSGWVTGPVILVCGSFGGIGGAAHLIGRGLDVDASLATLDEASCPGDQMLDTAERYAGGASETMIGRWLAERDRSVTAVVRITTKVAPPALSGGDMPFDSSFIEPLFAGSLERLGVDHVEWLLTHAPDDRTPVEGRWWRWRRFVRRVAVVGSPLCQQRHPASGSAGRTRLRQSGVKAPLWEGAGGATGRPGPLLALCDRLRSATKSVTDERGAFIPGVDSAARRRAKRAA